MLHMKILVTGGSGFIGTNLIKHISIDLNIKDLLSIDIERPPVVNTRCKYKICDINNYEQLKCVIEDFCPTHIINLAADTGISKSKREDEFKTNTKGVENILHICNKLKYVERIIFASTVLVNRLGLEPEKFDHYDAETPYGKSKIEGEILVRENSRLPWIIVRPISVWGPCNKEPYLQFMQAIEKGYYFNISKKDSVRTASYVGNIARQLISLLLVELKQVEGKTFYLGDTKPISIKKMSILVKSHLKGKNKVSIIEMPYRVARLLGRCGDMLLKFGIKSPLTTYRLKNITKSYRYNTEPINSINVFSEIPMEVGVEEMVAWYKGNQVDHK